MDFNFSLSFDDTVDTIISFAIVLIFVFSVNYITNVIKKRKANKNDEQGVDETPQNVNTVENKYYQAMKNKKK